MKKSRFTEEQIIGIVKQHEAGVKTADLCREHGISPATFYGWKSKYGGMDVSEAQRLRVSFPVAFADHDNAGRVPAHSLHRRVGLLFRSTT